MIGTIRPIPKDSKYMITYIKNGETRCRYLTDRDLKYQKEMAHNDSIAEVVLLADFDESVESEIILFTYLDHGKTRCFKNIHGGCE